MSSEPATSQERPTAPLPPGRSPASTAQAPQPGEPPQPLATSQPSQEPATVPATAVRYLKPPAPVYPAFSRRAGESGRVLIRVLIDETGSPRTLELQQSSGYARLDDSALAAVRATRFKPYTEDGTPRPVWVLIPIVFDLER